MYANTQAGVRIDHTLAILTLLTRLERLSSIHGATGNSLTAAQHHLSSRKAHRGGSQGLGMLRMGVNPLCQRGGPETRESDG